MRITTKTALLIFAWYLSVFVIACIEGSPTPAQENRAVSPTASAPAPSATPTRPAVSVTATTPQPSGTPQQSATPVTATGGLTLQDVQRAWEQKGMRVTAGGVSAGYDAFTARTTDLAATKGADALKANVLVYPNQDALESEWTASVDKGPAPKPGRRLPEYVTLWWNRNMVIIVRERSGQISDEARDAFINLSQ